MYGGERLRKWPSGSPRPAERREMAVCDLKVGREPAVGREGNAGFFQPGLLNKPALGGQVTATRHSFSSLMGFGIDESAAIITTVGVRKAKLASSLKGSLKRTTS